MDCFSINSSLVSAIKEYPCLYDSNLSTYTKKEITDKAWNEVSNVIGISAGECKEKWKNLRWGFIRSLRPNPDGSVRKKYYLHDQMEFVLPFIKLLPKQGSYIVPPHIDSDTDEENMKLIGNEFLEYETLQEAPYKKAKIEPVIKKATENTEIIKNRQSQFFEYDILSESYKHRTIIHEPTRPETETDSRRMFLLSLLPELNVLTEKQMRAFRRKVFELIDEIVEDMPKCDGNSSKEQTLDTTLRFQTEIIKTEIPD